MPENRLRNKKNNKKMENDENNGFSFEYTHDRLFFLRSILFISFLCFSKNVIVFDIAII